MKKSQIMFTYCLLFSFWWAVTAGAAVVGDINSDGKIDLTEAMYALQVTAGLYPNVSPSCLLAGKGEWAQNTDYITCDVVRQGTSFYICTADHTSSSTFADDVDKWTMLALQAAWNRNGTSIYYTGGRVGVGTMTPTVNLDVMGSFKADQCECGTLQTTNGEEDILHELLLSPNVDLDNDGLPNSQELTGDTDGDGVRDIFDPDSDGDGVQDGDDGDPVDAGVLYFPVTAFTAVADGSDPTLIHLTWTASKSSPVTHTIIRRALHQAPQNPSDGDGVGDVTGTSINDPNRPPETYYYSAFAADDSGQTAPAAHAGPVTVAQANPVTNVAVSSASGTVHLTWTHSPTIGYGRTRIVKKEGSYPSTPTDGTLVAEVDDGIEVYDDSTGTIWSTWYYSLFAANSSFDDFSGPAEAGTDGTFVHGRRTCPSNQVLVGVSSNDVVCSSPSLSTTLECVSTSPVLGSAGNPVTVSCPAGYSLTGGGFEDIDQNGPGDVGDEFNNYPTDTGWYLQFEDEAGGFNGYARCCRTAVVASIPADGNCAEGQMITGLAGVSGPDDGLTCGAPFSSTSELDCVTVMETGGMSGNPITATCPAGRFVTGGGFEDIDQDGGGDTADEFTSYPSNNGWYVEFEDEVGGFNAYARCCRSVVSTASSSDTGACQAGKLAVGVTSTESGSTLVCATPTVTSSLNCTNLEETGGTSGNPITATCPAGSLVTGGGFYDIDQNGDGDASDDFSSYPSGNGWYVEFEDEIGGFNAEAVCCSTSGASITISAP